MLKAEVKIRTPHPGPLPIATQCGEGVKRWVCIGVVKADWFFKEGGWGCPGGWLITWRGRQDWCQPWQFLKWDELVWAVRRRLEIAKLKLVALAGAKGGTPYAEVERGDGEGELWCLVERAD